MPVCSVHPLPLHSSSSTRKATTSPFGRLEFMAPQVHQLRKLHTYVPLYLAALSPRTGLVPARLQPPPSTLHPHSLCLHCSVDRPPPTDYLATNHAPGSPSKENCLDVACNHGSISTQLGEGTPAQPASRLYTLPANSADALQPSTLHPPKSSLSILTQTS